MESNDKLKEIDRQNCTCYYINDLIKIKGFDLHNILVDEKSYESILVCNISYKSLIDSKPLRIRFDKIDGFIRVYDGAIYLVLFGIKKYDSIYNRIRYLISVTSGTTYIISHNYAKIKVDSYDSLPLEKRIIFHNVIILIKSVFHEGKNSSVKIFYMIFFLDCH